MTQDETPETLLLALPVRGLYITDSGPISDPFARPWSVVGSGQMDGLNNLGLGSSFNSNIAEMRRIAQPTAIFLYRFQYPPVGITKAAEMAEHGLAALAMCVLLHQWPPRQDTTDPSGPVPVFRARYSEYYDQPIGVGRTGLKVRGGGKSIFHLLRPDWIQPEPRLTLAGLNSVIEAGPGVARRVLAQSRLSNRDRRLASGMSIINNAFQTLSKGAFVSSMVSAAEVLVDSQGAQSDREQGSSWKRRKARILSIVGSHREGALERVLQTRHDFVHSGAQPQTDLPPLASLGMALEVWTVIEQLYEQHGSAQDVETLIDCVTVARRSSDNGPAALASLRGALPRGASMRLPWIDYWLDLVERELPYDDPRRRGGQAFAKNAPSA